MVNKRLLRGLLLSIIFKVSNFIKGSGTLIVCFTDGNSPSLTVEARYSNNAKKEREQGRYPFDEIDIRRIADKFNIRIIEEESTGVYSIRIVIPSSMIIEDGRDLNENFGGRLKDLEIAIVEDEKELRDVLYEIFSSMGNRVIAYAGGEEAIADLQYSKLDILIADYGIDGVTGLELAARVKERNEDVLTVLLSGWILNDIKTYKNVIDVYYHKPFKIDELLKGISKNLLIRRSERNYIKK